MTDEPNKITATLKVVVSGEFYDNEASEETLRYCVEQDLEDAGFDVDVKLLKEQYETWKFCPHCGRELIKILVYDTVKFCPHCGRELIWND